MNVLVLPGQLDDNRLFRAVCLWHICNELGWQLRVVGEQRAGIWEPVAAHPFAATCSDAPAQSGRVAALEAHAAWADVVIATKPWGPALQAGRIAAKRAGTPLLFDSDDPELEIDLRRRLDNRAPAWSPRRARQEAGRLQTLLLRRRVKAMPSLASNPSLQKLYGGTVVPHAQPEPRLAPEPHLSSSPRVVFVGTVRAHKGIEVLRAGLERLADDGFTLTVTAEPPDDAKPWEHWIGDTSFEESEALLAGADIAAVPILDGLYGRYQLPAKVISAMLHRCAVVASDVPPVRWALGDSSLLFAPGDVEGFVAAARRLADPGVRDAVAGRLLSRAKQRFTPTAVAPVLRTAVAAVAPKAREGAHAAQRAGAIA